MMSEELPMDQSDRWVFLPGVFGTNAGLRRIAHDQRYQILDLPQVGSSLREATVIADESVLDRQRSFILIGSSYGCLVALRLAGLMPDRCRGVVLINPPSLELPVVRTYIKSLWLSVFALLWLLPKRASPHIARILVSKDPVFRQLIADPERTLEYRNAVLKTLRSLPLVAARVMECVRTDVGALIRRCSKQVLVIRSDGGSLEQLSKIDGCKVLGIGTDQHLPLIADLDRCLRLSRDWAHGEYERSM